MRLASLMLPFNRLVFQLSVRTRVGVLAVIPVLGFAAIGLNYVASERDVATAFHAATQAAKLSDASRDFKSAVAAIRIGVKDFSAKPSDELIAAFDKAHRLAVDSLNTIEMSVDRKSGQNISILRDDLVELQINFNKLVVEQQTLGYNESEGLRGRLLKTGVAVERIINENMTWLAEADARKLMISLLAMRHHEAEYRLQPIELTEMIFNASYAEFTETFASIDGTPEMKDNLEAEVKNYANTFRQWVMVSDRLFPLRAIIDIDCLRMLPFADQFIASAKESAAAASDALMESQGNTRASILAVGIGVTLLGLGFSWMIGRSINRPLTGLADVMKRLAAGDTSAHIPATRARDEIGDMARTVIVFRDSMVEREELAEIQTEAGLAREQRSEAIAATIGQFKHSVENALGKLRAAAMQLEASSGDLNKAADTVSSEATTAEQRVTAASENVTSAAGSVEELSASIGEIASQAVKSTEVADRAVSEVQRTVTTMSELGNAASRIGEVVGLIQAIAGQTNLLALNATIEAARAGESGKGFAVVASEVKSLAAQTAKATEEIAGHIGSIQSAAADSVQAIEQVNAIIKEMSSIASMVAATVDEQNAAVLSIAEGVNRASDEAKSGASAMSRVSGVTGDARSTAVNVKSLADAVAVETEGLESEVRQFLTNVQAA